MKTKARGIHANFTSTCHVCGGEITVTNSRQEPHTCRIETPDRPVTLADIRAALGNRNV